MTAPQRMAAWPDFFHRLMFGLATAGWLLQCLVTEAAAEALVPLAVVMTIATVVFWLGVENLGWGGGSLLIRGVRVGASDVASLSWLIGTVLALMGSWMALAILSADAPEAARTPAVFIGGATLACVGALYCFSMSVFVVKVNNLDHRPS